MNEWVNVTDSFSESQRHYKNTYLEICEVFDEVVEVSLFSSEKDPYEIYFSFGIMYGIVYAGEGEAYEKRESGRGPAAPDAWRGHAQAEPGGQRVGGGILIQGGDSAFLHQRSIKAPINASSLNRTSLAGFKMTPGTKVRRINYTEEHV